MPDSRRIHSAPHAAVLFVYDPASEVPLPVEPGPDSLIVIVPSGSENLAAVRAFFDEAAATLGLVSQQQGH